MKPLTECIRYNRSNHTYINNGAHAVVRGTKMTSQIKFSLKKAIRQPHMSHTSKAPNITAKDEEGNIAELESLPNGS